MFPEAPRVIYKKSPLEEVICQLRFAPILKITETEPAAFQEAIRHEFSDFTQQFQTPNLLLSSNTEGDPSFLEAFKSTRWFDFISPNRDYTLSLRVNSLSLTASNYTVWKHFSRRLEVGLNALEECYRPIRYGRIGLRYQNVIRRYPLGLSGKPWNDLINPVLSNVYTEPIFSNRIEAEGGVLAVNSPENIRVRIQYGLLQNVTDVDGSTCYLIDNDFSVDEEGTLEQAWNTLTKLNRASGRVFRWCISDGLHQAMEPKAARRVKN